MRSRSYTLRHVAPYTHESVLAAFVCVAPSGLCRQRHATVRRDAHAWSGSVQRVAVWPPRQDGRAIRAAGHGEVRRARLSGQWSGRHAFVRPFALGLRRIGRVRHGRGFFSPHADFPASGGRCGASHRTPHPPPRFPDRRSRPTSSHDRLRGRRALPTLSQGGRTRGKCRACHGVAAKPAELLQ